MLAALLLVLAAAPVEDAAFRDGRILICTSDELGVEAAAGAQRGFCGAYDRDGRELFRLAGQEAAGVTREAYALAPEGRQALFALTRPRPGGEREIVGYRLWSKGKSVELLPADGPRTRRVLESFEGKLVLPSPAQGH